MVLEFIQQLKPIRRLRLFVTSRQRPHDIDACFRDYSKIEIQAHESDIKRYMYQEIRAANVEEYIDEKFAAEIVETIIEKAQGM